MENQQERLPWFRLAILGASVVISYLSIDSSIGMLKDLATGLNDVAGGIDTETLKKQQEALADGLRAAGWLQNMTIILGVTILASAISRFSLWCARSTRFQKANLEKCRSWIFGHAAAIDSFRSFISERANDFYLLIVTSLLVLNLVLTRSLAPPLPSAPQSECSDIAVQLTDIRTYLGAMIQENCRGPAGGPIPESDAQTGTKPGEGMAIQGTLTGKKDTPRPVVDKPVSQPRKRPQTSGTPNPPGLPAPVVSGTGKGPVVWLDHELLRPEWFHSNQVIPFRKAEGVDIDYLWISADFNATKWRLEFVPWSVELLKQTDLSSKKSSVIATDWIHRLLQAGWAREFSSAKRSERVALVEGRVVEYEVRKNLATGIFDPGKITFDIRITDRSSGILIAAIHHRKLSLTTSTDDGLKKWIGKFWNIEGSSGGGLHRQYLKAEKIDG